MPKQLNSSYNEVAIPFSKMNFVPDVPSSALGANEYNDGLNVESDVRGIRSVAGDLDILTTIPGTPTFVTGGFRKGTPTGNSSQFWFIVATTEGIWYAGYGKELTDIGAGVYWYDITPGGTPIPGYAQNTNITEAWNGTVPFFNDTVGAPMFLAESNDLVEYPILTQYSNLIIPTDIASIAYYSPTEQLLTFDTPYATAPYIAGQQILIKDVDNFYNGIFTVTACTTDDVTYLAVPGGAYPGGGSVASAYTWNYDPNWEYYYANFMRLYSTPNVGSILVAGNLTVKELDSIGGEIKVYPVTVQWSQAFGLNQAPLTWQPTITNVANQLEVPLRGPALDAFPCNGQFFLCSYWDTVVFSPINYSTTSAPILGVRLYNQGRGLLSSNCWANTDKMVYGVDARDIWVFDGTDFQGLGNQQVKSWFFDQLDPLYYDRVFMEVNSQKNQVEIYYYTIDPDSPGDTVGVPNRMLSYRYDLQVWNAPRVVTAATFSCESPIWSFNEDTDEWEPSLGSRTIVYARGETDQQLIQKDYGYEINNEAIHSYFKRSNIKLLKDYSGKLMVHRLLPETVNIGGIPFTGDYNKQVTESTGNVSVRIEGSESVGQLPVETTNLSISLNTSNPWMQPDQNSHRVNTITIENTSNTDIWMTTATTWQFTQVEDDR